ncbi:hypothetical protein L0F63_006351 [Massospora cicadina]|nr:hypothetical protein L0F63_006351 [Massospora cicadina]
MNEVANCCYSATFGIRPSNRSIDALQAKEVDGLKANCWMMSPPCQPFTRGGCMRDDTDPRSKPLLHLVELLPTLANPPALLMLENVKNFEISNCRNKLVDMLVSLKYAVFEFLLSPWQFEVPNHRLRYYLVARRLLNLDLVPQPAALQTRWPLERTGSFLDNSVKLVPTFDSLCSLTVKDFKCRPLGDILSPLADKNPTYLVPPKYLRPNNFRYDIVTAYGSHHLFGSGSLIHSEPPTPTPTYDYSDLSSLAKLGLRFFTPWEIAILHGVPVAHKDHTCPANAELDQATTTLDFSGLSEIQRYRLLGNSLSVTVVAGLLKLMFS